MLVTLDNDTHALARWVWMKAHRLCKNIDTLLIDRIRMKSLCPSSARKSRILAADDHIVFKWFRPWIRKNEEPRLGAVPHEMSNLYTNNRRRRQSRNIIIEA